MGGKGHCSPDNIKPLQRYPHLFSHLYGHEGEEKTHTYRKENSGEKKNRGESKIANRNMSKKKRTLNEGMINEISSDSDSDSATREKGSRGEKS